MASPQSSAESASQSVVERVQDFVSENKKAILLCAAATAVAVGGVAAYHYSTSRPGGGSSDLEKGDKKKGKSSSGKKKKSVKDADGPILEERKPSSRAEADVNVNVTPEEAAAMSTEERSKLAAALKAKGNSEYSARQFEIAAEHYTRAIEISPKPEAVFYSNRAACYVNMSPPKYEQVIDDCTEALKLDVGYIKALNRRATALEAVERYKESLRDFTAAAMLDHFKSESTANSVERVLKKYATKDAATIIATREPRLPSHNFVTAYFAAFRPRPHPPLPENPTTGDETLALALQALEAMDYKHALTLVNESIEQGISTPLGQAEALNLRATFKFLLGEVLSAKVDLEKSIELIPTFSQSWVKVASVYMEQGDAPKAFECFEEAIKQNPNDPDIYYHRGQVLFIMNQFDEAAQNYNQSMEIDQEFVFSHIQLAVAQYKAGNLAKSMATFRETLRKFPQRSEPQNYYGELLMDQQRYPDAVEKFERAFELEKTKTTPNVLPLVNKGLTLYQWKQDSQAAEECCAEALRIDPDCDSAVGTLIQLTVQQGRPEETIEHCNRAIELARAEPELIQSLTFKYATEAQLEFQRDYPEFAAQLQQLRVGGGMM
jgi:import receptor subunit TOM70